jgi:hypothetical protein
MTSRPRKSRPRPQLNASSLGVFSALSTLARSNEAIGVLELARRLEIPASTAHRALATLESSDFVAREEGSSKYHLGNEARRLTNSFFNMFPIRGVSMLYLRRLALLTGHTAALWVRIGPNMVKIAAIEGSQEVINQRPIGQSLGLRTCPAGLALLGVAGQDARVRSKAGAKADKQIEINGFIASQSGQVTEFASAIELPDSASFASIVIEAAVRFPFETHGAEARKIVHALEQHLAGDRSLAHDPFAHVSNEAVRSA